MFFMLGPPFSWNLKNWKVPIEEAKTSISTKLRYFECLSHPLFYGTKLFPKFYFEFLFDIIDWNSGKMHWSYQFPPSPFKHQPHEMVKHTQTIPRQQPTNCLNVFDHFVRLVLKGLTRCVTGLKWDNFEETILPNSVSFYCIGNWQEFFGNFG